MVKIVHEAEFIDISSVPLYNTDLDVDNAHEEYTKIRKEVAKYDAYIFVDIIAMHQPEVYLSGVQNFFDENGQMIEDTKNFLKTAVDAFVAHANRLGVK